MKYCCFFFLLFLIVSKFESYGKQERRKLSTCEPVRERKEKKRKKQEKPEKIIKRRVEIVPKDIPGKIITVDTVVLCDSFLTMYLIYLCEFIQT